MRFLSWLITIPIVTAAVVFALHNREEVSLNFWPFDVQLALPLSFLVLGILFAGVILGMVVMSLSNMKLRMQKFTLQRKVEKLTLAATKQTDKPSVAVKAETVMHQGRLQIISNTDERISS